MLVIKDLMKTYSSGVHALKGISLDIQPGLFGLLGPNGAVACLALAHLLFTRRSASVR